MNKKIRLFTLLGIVVLAVLLRFYQLGINPPSLDWDEASIGYNAYSILHTGRDEYRYQMPLSFRSFDDYKPPVYIYLTVPSVALFGLNEFAVRFPAAFIGVLAVIVVYFLTKELLITWPEKTKEYISLTAAFFIAISPWHLQFSRASFEGNIGMFFLVFSLLCFLKGLKNAWWYVGFAIGMILSMYSYHSFRLIDPLIILTLLILFGKGLLRQKRQILFSLVAIIILTIPIYLSFLHPEGTGARLSMVTIFSDPKLQATAAAQSALAKKNHDIFWEILYNRRIIFIPQMIHGYFDHFGFNFLFLHGDGGVQHHAYNMGMLYLWDLPFIIIGIIALLRKRNARILLLFIIFLLAPLPASITTGTPHPVRAIGMIPAFQLFAAAGFVTFCLFFTKKNVLGKVIIGIASILLVINIGYYLYSYYHLTPIKYGYFWQYGNKQAVQYAKAHESTYKNILMSYQYDQPYVYYLFYNKIDPQWYQTHWNYSGTGQMDRFYRKVGKYEFSNITPHDFTRKQTLLIATPSEIERGVGKIVDTIYFPDGKIAYQLIAL